MDDLNGQLTVGDKCNLNINLKEGTVIPSMSGVFMP